MTDKANFLSYVVNGFAALFGLVTMEMLAVTIGIVMCLATYATTLYFQRLKNKRDIELHRLQVASLKAHGVDKH